MTEFFAIYSSSEDEDNDAWEKFDARYQLGDTLRHLPKRDAKRLYLESDPLHNLDTRLICQRDGSMEAVRQWAWTCNMQEPALRAAVLLDVGHVLSELYDDQLRQLHCGLRSREMTNVAIFICTRGKERWRDLLRNRSLYNFSSMMDGVLITRHLERHDWRNPELFIEHPIKTPFHFVSFENGDKGDCARFLRVPCLLFDDKLDNLKQVRAKGSAGTKGVLVTKRRNPRTVPWQTHVSDVGQWPGIVLHWLANLPH